MTSLQLVRHYAECDNDIQLVICYAKLCDNVIHNDTSFCPIDMAGMQEAVAEKRQH